MMERQALSLIVLSVAGAVVSIGSPELFSQNKFLVDFINHEYVSVLAVLVTVSMVSVVQLHLEYTRIERKFNMRVFADARKSVNLSALILATLLCASFVLSFMRAELSESATAASFIHIAALLTLLEAIFIMFNLVDTACAMAEDEPLNENDDSTN